MFPDTTPTTSTPGVRMSDDVAVAEARRIIADAYRTAPETPTSYRDDSPLPAFGDMPPVLQPDRRIVPAWAAGTAVAGIGVGAAFVGVGCGLWLACQGFAAVSLTSVLFVTLPIAAVAGVFAAIGTALRSLKGVHTETHHHYTGPIQQHHSSSKTYGVIARTHNEHNG
ncbi:hypothetical protein [Streptomyces sp. NPDC093223]|uniref:hypothetical protein n=1 Tax=Streptomyces sp. NPDC093223 TaxID=3366033 RepID=UPI00380674CD